MGGFPSQYNWLRDAGIVLAVLALVFYFDPIDQVFTAMGRLKDGGLWFILLTVAIVTSTALAISLRHYWKWVIVETFGIAAITILHSYGRHYEQYYSLSLDPYVGMNLYQLYLWDALGNGVACFIFVLPVMTGVRLVRRKIKRWFPAFTARKSENG